MTAGDNLLNAVIFVLALNLVMFIVGGAIEDLSGSNPFDYNDNALSKFNSGNSTTYDLPAEPGDFLPGGIQAVEPDTGGFFTDIFSTIKSFFLDTLGLGYVLSILSGPKVILSVIGLPEALAWALSALWYGVTVMIIASYITGR